MRVKKQLRNWFIFLTKCRERNTESSKLETLPPRSLWSWWCLAWLFRSCPDWNAESRSGSTPRKVSGYSSSSFPDPGSEFEVGREESGSLPLLMSLSSSLLLLLLLLSEESESPPFLTFRWSWVRPSKTYSASSSSDRPVGVATLETADRLQTNKSKFCFNFNI